MQSLEENRQSNMEMSHYNKCYRMQYPGLLSKQTITPKTNNNRDIIRASVDMEMSHYNKCYRMQYPGLLSKQTITPKTNNNRDIIRASVDALYRDGTGQISRDPRTKRHQT